MTRETITELHRLSDEVAAKKELSQELIKTAQDRFKDNEVELERNGKLITVAEKVLWDEVYHLGLTSQAGLKLKELHPEVFEALNEQNKAADTLKLFCIEQLGVDYTQMTLSDYVHVTEQLFKVLQSEATN
jgi:hypothetical protein